MSEAQSEPDYLLPYEQQLAQQREQASEALAVICDRLLELGVESLSIAYDGYGDSGTIESVTAFNGESQELELAEEIQEEVTTAAESLLPWGWENNEGAFGEFILNVPERRLVREHNIRVESTDYEEESWQL